MQNMFLVGLFTVTLAISCTGAPVATTADSGPVLQFIPTKADSHLISYNSRDSASVHQWTFKLDEVFEGYSGINATGLENRMFCSPDSLPSGKLYCDVPLSHFGPCVPENQYNYHRAAPCVFLKLDNLLNWTPNPYNTSEDLPNDMPENLKQHINLVTGRKQANTVWVSCEGKNPSDAMNIGPIQYFPDRGFPMYYFPYANQEGYLSPLVAVYFEKPKIGILISIECTVWAKNIFNNNNNNNNNNGPLQLDLLVD